MILIQYGILIALKQENSETGVQRGMEHISKPTTPENSLAISTDVFSGGKEKASISNRR
jgi:hypothetical protein